MGHRRERVANEPDDSIVRRRAGVLFLVATPIGNLGDLGTRARDTLRDVDLLLAEDTRHTSQLLHACGIARAAGSVESLHEHNERARAERVVERLREGASVALVSDAGTPLVSDPGAALVRAAIDAGVEVVAVPGPCAAIAALCVAGLPTDRFTFEGFLPSKRNARLEALRSLASEPRTLVFYEAPHRLQESLADMVQSLGAARPAAVAREITKRFESVYRGTVATLAEQSLRDPDMSRGEIVIVVGGATEQVAPEDAEVDQLLRALLAELPVSQAAKVAARVSGRPRKQLYDRALALGSAPES
jgi:16S rRNA (cytidine1402-2'-O)-methyltransferase